MAARVIDADQPIDVRQLCCLFYGQPGSRKTSLAQTADDPITLAFDEGIYRAYGRKRAVMFESWHDVVAFDVGRHRTVIVDTIGMALDLLAAALINDNPKNANRMGGLSLPGFGALRDQFKQWVSRVKSRGVDLVFIAHEREDKNGEEPYFRPDIVGGSYATLMNICDVVGYLHFAGGRRMLDLAPTDTWMAKIPPWGRAGSMELPDFGSQPRFLADLMAEAKSSMGRVSAASSDAVRVVDGWRQFLDGVLDCDDAGSRLELFNDELPKMSGLANGIKSQVWHLVNKFAADQGWRYDQSVKRFVEIR
jgi:hypothetical protein